MPGIETMDRIYPVSVAPLAAPSLMVSQTRSGLTILAFSSDLDKLLAVFTLATSAAAMDMPVTVFFAFWGLVALKRRTRFQGKGLLGMLITAMQPSRPEKLGLSKWNMLGLGRRLFGVAMRKNRMETLQRLIDLSGEMNVRMVAFETSMAALAITREELRDGVEIGGAATFLEAAQSSGATLFI